MCDRIVCAHRCVQLESPLNIDKNGPLARVTVQAIRTGDLQTLKQLLDEHAELAMSRIASSPDGCEPNAAARTLLHIATDWPGHFPNGAATVAMLIEAGAEVNAPFTGRHVETPLHWAASSDDVEVLDALLDRGADIEAPGAVIGGGTPLADAVAFGQWRAARRLLERGAHANLWQAAALGLMDRVRQFSGDTVAPPADEITKAFWCACHGGQRESAAYLLERGADVSWVGFDDLTPLDAARRSGAEDVARWLEGHGAKSTRTRR
jgi:ankyrin repeat protein